MEFNVDTASPETKDSACAVIGVFDPQQLSHAGELLDKASDGQPSAILAAGDMDGELGQTLMDRAG